MTTPNTRPILNVTEKDFFFSTADAIFLPPLAIIHVLIPVGIVFAGINFIYKTTPVSGFSSGKAYGVKKPGKIIPPHKRKYYKEFFLPNWNGDSDFLGPVYKKNPTVDPMIIFSDFVYYRGKWGGFLYFSCRFLFSSVYFQPSVVISVFLAKQATTFLAVHLPNKLILSVVQNKIILTIVIYSFAGVLANNAVLVSIDGCNLAFESIVRVYSFLSEKISGSKPS